MSFVCRLITATLFVSITLLAGAAQAASCCGGGSGGALVLPKFAKAMLGVSVSYENYDGFWNQQGTWRPDPSGSKLQQSRMDLGGAYRLADRWQVAASLPLVMNNNQYPGIQSKSQGTGDAVIAVQYEAFDNIMCVWDVYTLEDLMPAIYFGMTLTVPTGVSAYDDVQNNFDITGRGFYRVDGNILLDKTIYPWNATLALSYGSHFSRPVNREYGVYVQPYRKKLGDRANMAISAGYTIFTERMDNITATVSLSDLWEGAATIDGQEDPTSGLRKHSVATSVSWLLPEGDWTFKAGWNHSLQRDNWGRNFPTTDVFSMGVNYVFR